MIFAQESISLERRQAYSSIYLVHLFYTASLICAAGRGRWRGSKDENGRWLEEMGDMRDDYYYCTSDGKEVRYQVGQPKTGADVYPQSVPSHRRIHRKFETIVVVCCGVGYCLRIEFDMLPIN